MTYHCVLYTTKSYHEIGGFKWKSVNAMKKFTAKNAKPKTLVEMAAYLTTHMTKEEHPQMMRLLAQILKIKPKELKKAFNEKRNHC